ncbi:MAG: hypothetical protein FWH41_08120 [Treponema sp.]|nr:hypothetical protein [Treponema sp.]
MGIILLIVLAILVIYLIPRIRKWARTKHCPNCGKWFCLNFQRFAVTDRVVGYNRKNSGWGHIGSLIKGGFFFNRGGTREDPFIREWGEAHYTCRSCGGTVTLYNVRRDK